MYVPDPRSSGSLIQAMDYVGCQRKIGTVGRRVAEGEGVVGRAFRLAKLEPENPAILDGQRSSNDHDGFVAEMVSCYGFSKERAATLSPATPNESISSHRIGRPIFSMRWRELLTL